MTTGIQGFHAHVQGFPRSTVENTGSELIISQWNGTQLPDPVTVEFNEADFRGYVASIRDSDVAELWPGLARETAAFRLLSIQLEELLVTVTPFRRFVLTSDGFKEAS